jgi:hypothetical protein
VRGSFLVPALLSLVLAGGARAQTSPEKEKAPPASVEKLIELLGDNDYEVRDRANRKLLELGAEALPALRKAIDHPDAEIRRRLKDMVPAIETAVILSPKLITLNAEKQTVKQIVDELTKQTGYRFEFWGGNADQTFSFQIKKKPLWQTLDAICDTTGMVVIGTYSEEAIRLQMQDSHVPHISYDGPFRVVATGFQLVKNNNFGQLPRTNPVPQRNDSLMLNLMIYAEPKLPVLSIGQPVIASAYDENKVSMNPDSPERNVNNPIVARSFYRSGGYKMYSMQTSVNLLLPADNSRTLKHIKGNIPVSLLTSQKADVLTTDILKAKGKKFESGPIGISIEDVTAAPGSQVQIKMNITNSESKDNPNDYTWQNSIYQRIEVQDEQGNKFMNTGSNWGGNGPGHMLITMNYGPPGNVKAGAAAKFIFHNWTSMQSAIIFEFKELPLP